MAPAKPEPSAAPLSAAGIQQRIDDERNRLLIEQNLAHSLAGQRLAPLEAGDDEALDRVEAQFAACNERQFRIQERLEILEQRLTQAQEREAQAELDAIAARANKAREIGERLIKGEYKRHAEALAGVLAKLHAIDTFIDARNRELERGGHELVSSPNSVRCRPCRSWQETVRKQVGVGEPEHPFHEKWNQQGGRYDESYSRSPQATIHATGETFDKVMEVDVVEDRFEAADWVSPLHKMVVPGVGPAAQGETVGDLWRGQYAQTDPRAVEAIESEVDGDGVIAKAGKSAARLLHSLVAGGAP